MRARPRRPGNSEARLRDRFRRIGLDPERVLGAYPSDLPGGMKQRVVIGISTLLNPRVVIADEPTSALDVTTQKAVIRLLFDLIDEGIVGSMLFITHELPLLRHVASSIAVMYAGEFVEYGRAEEVIFDPVHPYTRALMGAMLSAEPGQRDRRPVAIEGAPPNPRARPRRLPVRRRGSVRARRLPHRAPGASRAAAAGGEVSICRVRDTSSRRAI